MDPIRPQSNFNIELIKTNISKIEVQNHNVISKIDAPVLHDLEIPVTRGLALPVFDIPNTGINYPIINVPTQAEFDAAVKAEKEKQQEERPKERALPNTTPPQLPQIDRKSTRLNSSH